MLACVCQPAETSLYKGGPPTELGPLGSNPRRHQRPRTLKSYKTSKETDPSQRSSDDSKSSSEASSTPRQRKSPKTLLNLRKIEEKAKSTKILVNPICCDTSNSSDDNYSPCTKDKVFSGILEHVNHNSELSNKIDISKITTNSKEDTSNNTRKVDTPNSVDISAIKGQIYGTEAKQTSIIVKELNGKVINCVVDNSEKDKIVDDISGKNPHNEPTFKANAFITGCDKSKDYKVILTRDQNKHNKTVSSDQQKSSAFVDQLPEGVVGLTLGELRAMALRQQHQIDTQHQLLAAKEQRLRYLKQQEAKHHQVAAEGERLRRLRERVEAQELKLRKLRALRGHVDKNKLTNVTLTSDLESIRALFNEKEKELSVAVAKVEELTRQLEEVRRGRGGATSAPPPTASQHELDKLRRELMYRNKLNEQQNARLSQQRCALGARQDEMRSIDRRIAELQARLLRKRTLNSQLARQRAQPPPHAVQPQQQQDHRPPHQRLTNPAAVQLTNNYTNSSNTNTTTKPQVPRGNIAAVEPYNHIPHAQSVNHAQNFQALKQNNNQNGQGLKHYTQSDPMQSHLTTQETHYLQHKQMSNQHFNNGNFGPLLQVNLLQGDGMFPQQLSTKAVEANNFQNQVPQGIVNHYIHQSDQKVILDHIGKYNIDLQKAMNQAVGHNLNTSPQETQQSNSKQQKTSEQEFLPEFAASKSDPKYQTLPYNTKFALNGMSTKSKSIEEKLDPEIKVSLGTTNNLPNASSSGINHMTVHSTPLSVINKSLATPLNQGDLSSQVYHNEQSYQIQKSDSGTKCNQEGKENAVFPNLNGRLACGEPTKLNGIVQNKMQVNALGRMDNLIRGVGTMSSTSSSSSLASSSTGHTKPVSSVAPNTVQASVGKPSPIYQTSSTKIQPVQPQTVSHSLLQPHANAVATQPQIARQAAPGLPPTSLANHNSYHFSNQQQGSQNVSSQSLMLSPPQSASTPFATPDVSTDASTPKPALPPKPPVKTPPRQSGTLEPNHQPSEQHKEPQPQPLSSDSPLEYDLQNQAQQNQGSNDNQPMIIKARPLTIRKQPLAEQPKLRNLSNGLSKPAVSVSINRRIEMPPAFLFPEMNQLPTDGTQFDATTNVPNHKLHDKLNGNKIQSNDELDRVVIPQTNDVKERHSEDQNDKNIVADIAEQINSVDLNNANIPAFSESHLRRSKKGNLKQEGKVKLSRRVSFDPLALLLDASLEGELELVKKTATQVPNASTANDEGITALHNAICAGHFDIVKFLVEFGCDVNAQDSDGWTPLHCAASCNNVAMVRFLVENGACIFATTLSDHETAAEKCEEDEEGFDGCSEYLYSVQEKLGIMNSGVVYAVFSYTAQRSDELSFVDGDKLAVVRKGDDNEREWWWSKRCNNSETQTPEEGYVPRNLLGLYPRVIQEENQ